jgi:hypothetical protein
MYLGIWSLSKKLERCLITIILMNNWIIFDCELLDMFEAVVQLEISYIIKLNLQHSNHGLKASNPNIIRSIILQLSSRSRRLWFTKWEQTPKWSLAWNGSSRDFLAHEMFFRDLVQYIVIVAIYKLSDS